MNRKTISIIVASLLVFGGNIQSQVRMDISNSVAVALNKKKVEPVLITGMNITNFAGDIEEFNENVNSLNGFDNNGTFKISVPAGLAVTIDATTWLSFKTGCFYMPKGMKYKSQFESTGSNYYTDLIYNLKYVEVPTLVGYYYDWYVQKGDGVGYYKVAVSGGVASSFLVSSKSVSRIWPETGDASDAEKSSEAWNEVNKFDLGVVAEVCFTINQGYLGLQYERGLKNLSTSGWDLHNQMLILIFGICLVNR